MAKRQRGMTKDKLEDYCSLLIKNRKEPLSDERGSLGRAILSPFRIIPAGMSTIAFLPAAGCHRASPSTSLDKSLIFNLNYIIIG